MANQSELLDIMELGAQLEQQLPSIKESQFRQNFLPLFTDAITDDKLRRQGLLAWISGIAQTPTMPVEVVDDVSNEVLFTVPPVLDSRMIMISEENKFADIAGMYQLQVRNMPETAEAMLSKHISDETTRSMTITLTDQWDAMNQYYGLKTATATTDTTEVEDVLGDMGL